MRVGATLLLALAFTGCASVQKDRIILLPAADGHRSGLLVKTGKDEVLMTEPHTVVEVRDGKITQSSLNAAEVDQRYRSVIQALPPPPRVFTVYFQFERTSLLPESRLLLKTIKADAEKTPASEIVITGHTDRVGTVPYNDALSLRRAEVVRDDFLSIGVPPSTILLEARGEREPLIPTEDGVPEPRNRRVVIKLR